MKKGWKITLMILGGLVFLLLIGPFLVPIPPLDNTQDPQALADPDSRFIEINQLEFHYKQYGSGEPVMILLHGFGASTFSWREVMEPLSDYGTVIAYDRPAFGLTERPLSWEGSNPYTQESNIDHLSGLMDALGIDQAVLVGNSAGGTLGTAFALEHPERVRALVQVNAAIYQTRPDSPALDWLFNTPQVDRLGPLITRFLMQARGDAFLESAWHDPSRLEENPDIIDGYRQPLKVENWDRALWEHTKAAGPPDLAGRLDQVDVQTLVLAGAFDQIVPLENSLQLAQDMPDAQLTVIENCGHLPQEECPIEFMAALNQFLTSIMEENND